MTAPNEKPTNGELFAQFFEAQLPEQTLTPEPTNEPGSDDFNNFFGL